MISSMTSFARAANEASFGSLTWELRSVNHRFLDCSVRLPEALRYLEKKVRDTIAARVSRGKVEASLKFLPGEDLPFDFVINEPLLKKLSQAANTVNQNFANAQTDIFSVLNWQGVLQTKDTRMEQVGEAMLILLNNALDDFVSMREREGEGLKQYLASRLDQIHTHIATVNQSMPIAIEEQKKKIQERLNEAQCQLDPERLEQELVFIAQKADVQEEIQRLSAHIKEAQSVLKKGGVCGRRLDFLMQEFNREANTLSSKSIALAITQAALEMKVLIEQMREQVQNIE